jgi:nitrogen fixation NifU-like protein
MDDFYRDNILDHYKNPRNFGTIEKPDASLIENNPFCGDRIGMEVKISEQQTEVKFQGEGCAISMASASMLTELVQGKSIEEIIAIKPETVTDMLGVELTPVRLKCALLSLQVLQKTLTLVKENKNSV